MTHRNKAIEIFLTGVESVKPDNLIKRFVSLNDPILSFSKLAFDLRFVENIYVIGAGKASAMMAHSIETILGPRIREGHIITKYHQSIPLQFITITEAGHPVPDQNGVEGTRKILKILKQTRPDDLVICLLSGGGSALLADIPENCTLDEVKSVNNILLKSGANIQEMNCIRKHLSQVKGGMLAKAASPASLVSLILSDVIGDPLDVIASGPTAPDPSTFHDAIAILAKYNLENQIPQNIRQFLLDGLHGKHPETLKEEDEIMENTYNLIIGNNKLALASAREKAESLGYETRIVTDRLEGDVEFVSAEIFNLAILTKQQNPHQNICLLFGGEPTVKVRGKGLGGRNQHLALLLAKLLKDHPGITFLSGGTDGTDGPTEAAGAVADSETSLNGEKLHLDLDEYIQNHDTYRFFKQEGGLINTGPTQTNVMDIMVILLHEK
ncbi:MAG: glycerate kinase [Prolixibacteraceae bacterium]